MKSMTPFQLVVTIVFVAFIVIGVGIFALFGGLLGSGGVGAVTIWGTMDQNTMGTIIDSMKSADKSLQDVTYVQKDPSTYEHDVVNAIAAGQAPDLVLISQDDLGALADKLLVIPYSAVSQSTYLNSYIDEAQLFLTGQGTLAMPLSVDPLVMYWNRDLFASAGIAQAPTLWNDFLTIAPKITSLDASSNVQRSAAALGGWSNVAHAKEILSTLFMQAGDPIIARDPQTGTFVSVFGTTPQGAPENPAESALRFYTEFADPAKTTYSWNRSLPDSTDMFVSGDLAVYFGYGSELTGIAQRNPNLRFGVALMPQLTSTASHTYGSLMGLAVPRGSKNPGGAEQVALKLTSQQAIQVVVRETGLPPVRRDVTLDTSASSAAGVLAQSALISAAWYDPDPSATDSIFETMVESVVSGSQEPASAVSEAAQQLSQFFKPQ